MKKVLIIINFLLLLLVPLTSQANPFIDFDFQDKENPSIIWETQSGYYLKSINIISQGQTVSFTQNKNNIILENNFKKGELDFFYIGCLNKDTCQPEQHITFKTEFQQQDKSNSFWEFINNTDEIINALNEKNLLLKLIIFFLMGILLAFTPCIFPMLPIVSSMVIQASKKNSLWTAISYSIGIALSYAFIGLIMGLMNINVQIYLQNKYIIWGISGFFFLLGALMLINYSFSFFNKTNNLLNDKVSKINPNNNFSVMSIGFLSSLIISPCAAAPIVGVLIYIQTAQHQLIEQILILFFLGLGAGTPLIIISTSLKKFMPKNGNWMNEIKVFFSLILFGVGIYTLQRTTFESLNFLYIILILGYIFHFLKPNKKQFYFYLISLLFMALFSMDFKTNESMPKDLIAYTKIDTLENLNQELDISEKNNKPVFIDIYADWCSVCIQMDRGTLSEPKIVDYLTKNYTTIKIDLSDITEEEQEILQYYRLQTAPAYIFYDSNGNKVDKTYVGYIEKENFSNIIKQQNK